MNALERLLALTQLRNISKEILYVALADASSIDLIGTLRICFYTRDIHCGLGKRKLGRWCFEWFAIFHPTIFIRLMQYIPTVGRWDDLLYINHIPMESLVFTYFQTQLQVDKINMILGYQVSFCAKWLPSEGKSFHKQYPYKFNRLLRAFNMSPKQYRHELKVLRRHANVPEHFINSKEWNKLVYTSIPKQSLKKHTKTFLKFDNKHFKASNPSYNVDTSNMYTLQTLEEITDTPRYEFINQLVESVVI